MIQIKKNVIWKSNMTQIILYIFFKNFITRKLISYILLAICHRFQMFLGKLFILFDQDRDELLKQDEWIEFLKERLT